MVAEADRLTSDLLAQYLEGVGRFDLLTAEDEVRLAQTIEAGLEARRRLDDGTFEGSAERADLEHDVARATQARSEFIEANLRLVVSNARRYAGADVDMIDLIQEGNIGLITAVERFDWRKGFKFSTYATWWIRQAMQRARANLSGSIRIPAGVFDILPMVRAAGDQLQTKLGRAPHPEEIAEETGIPVNDVERAMSVSTTVALESPVGEDGAALGDFITDEDAADPELEAERTIVADAVHRGLESLPERHRRVLELRFGLAGEAPATMAAISEDLEIPEHRIRAYVADALEILRERLAPVEEMRVA